MYCWILLCVIEKLPVKTSQFHEWSNDEKLPSTGGVYIELLSLQSKIAFMRIDVLHRDYSNKYRLKKLVNLLNASPIWTANGFNSSAMTMGDAKHWTLIANNYYNNNTKEIYGTE